MKATLLHMTYTFIGEGVKASAILQNGASVVFKYKRTMNNVQLVCVLLVFTVDQYKSEI